MKCRSCGTTFASNRCEACQTAVAGTERQTLLAERAIARRQSSLSQGGEPLPRSQAKLSLPRPVIVVLCLLTSILVYCLVVAFAIRFFGVGREIPGGVAAGIMSGLSIALAQWVDPSLFGEPGLNEGPSIR